jgi:hypothetical protein
MDHGIWNELLTTYVSTDGKVDYKGFKKDKNQLDAYLQMLSEHVPDKTWPDKKTGLLDQCLQNVYRCTHY